MASTGKNLLAVVSCHQERHLLPDRPNVRWKCAEGLFRSFFNGVLTTVFWSA